MSDRRGTASDRQAEQPGRQDSTKGADPDLLRSIDETYTHGIMRDWAVFTHTAAALRDDGGRERSIRRSSPTPIHAARRRRL